MKPAFFIGVDAGGTKTHVRIRDAKGRMLGEAIGGAGNLHWDYEGALTHIHATIADAISNAKFNVTDSSRAALGIGIAGLVSSGDEKKLAKEFKIFANVAIASDAETACLGAHGGKDGGIVITGTGSIGFARVKTKTLSLGGRGFLVSDEGSGARIGADALRHALLASEGLADETKFTQKLMARFDNNPTAVTLWAKTAIPADYAALAPIVLGFAEKGDAAALGLLKHHARALITLAARLRDFGAPRLSLVGGLSPKMLPWIALDAPDLFEAPLHDATDGAILLAGGAIA